MDQKTREIVTKALARYGARLTEDNFIATSEKGTSKVSISVKKNRLVFTGNGYTLGSGPIAESAITKFVEDFWFWKPTA